jgi:hypothetical protein
MKRIQLLLFIFLIGCAPNEVRPTTAVAETSEPTLTPTSTITSTPLPSPTAVPFTSTPITPVPTLPPKEQEAYLLNLIETNNHCRLPCLFGIQPGISTWEEIRSVEEPLHFRAAYLPDSNGFLYLYAHVTDKIEHLDIAFSGSGHLIEHITAATYIFLPSDPGYSPAIAKAGRAYSLPNILAEYGMPSRIRLYIQGQVAPNSGSLAEILLFYDHLGFGVHYFFLNAVTQDPVNSATRICLKDDHLESFKLYLQAPGDRTPLEKMVTVAFGGRFFPYDWLQPLEDMTTLSIEDFYNRFTSSPIIDCFDLGNQVLPHP